MPSISVKAMNAHPVRSNEKRAAPSQDEKTPHTTPAAKGLQYGTQISELQNQASKRR